MAHPIMDQILAERCTEAVTAHGDMCDARVTLLPFASVLWVP